MVKVDVISGFLGAGKTTLIKKLFESKISSEKTVIIENEFGEIGIDGSFLKEAGVQIREINSGCICCSLVGDFEESMKEVIRQFTPDRIIIEPSGVGKLSDIVRAIETVDAPLELNIVCTVVDGGKCRMYIKNFGEFYIDQVKEAFTVVVSKADKLPESKIAEAVEQIRGINSECTIITTPITQLTGDKLLEVLEEGKDDLKDFIEKLKSEHEDDEDECCHHHHHHHHEDGEECHCHHHHDDDDDDDEDEHEHHHHHDDDDDDEDEHEHHHHHHDDDENDDDEDEHEHHHHDDEHEHEHHHHHHHHGHDADEIFESWGINTSQAFSESELNDILAKLSSDENGVILRAKGILKSAEGGDWWYFDLVYGDYEIRKGAPDVMGKVCVIGSKFDEKAIAQLFVK